MTYLKFYAEDLDMQTTNPMIQIVCIHVFNIFRKYYTIII